MPSQKVMLTRNAILVASVLLGYAMGFYPTSTLSQSTAFAYQGRLQAGTNVANGSHDFVFAIWSAPEGPSQIGGSVTNLAVPVNQGLFTTTMDFGDAFDGNNRWLEIAVRTNGNGSFATLAPRQVLSPVPYAIFAGGVNASGITGLIPPSNIATGSVTAEMLAAGAVAASLSNSGSAAVPREGLILSSSANATNLLSNGYSRFGGPLDLSWQKITAAGAPAPRGGHTAVWTGSKMIIWGGVDTSGSNPKNTGAMYDPAENTWKSITTSNAPSARSGHTAIWTGKEMIIWGGVNGGPSNDGARYDPLNDTWSILNTTNAPKRRSGHSAVWSGTEMIIWGGAGENGLLNDGARYEAATDSWRPINTNNAPSARMLHTAIWTGTEFLVWGGLLDPTHFFGDGGRYSPGNDTWIPMSTNGAPRPRAYHSAIWTGNEMIIWGGNGASFYADAARYLPSTDSWSLLQTNSGPSARYSASTIWTGEELFVWGGTTSVFLSDGGRYNAVSDSWGPLATDGAPSPRSGCTALWTGTEMLIFGGYDNATTYGDCYSYAPGRVLYLYRQ